MGQSHAGSPIPENLRPNLNNFFCTHIYENYTYNHLISREDQIQLDFDEGRDRRWYPRLG